MKDKPLVECECGQPLPTHLLDLVDDQFRHICSCCNEYRASPDRQGFLREGQRQNPFGRPAPLDWDALFRSIGIFDENFARTIGEVLALDSRWRWLPGMYGYALACDPDRYLPGEERWSRCVVLEIGQTEKQDCYVFFEEGDQLVDEVSLEILISRRKPYPDLLHPATQGYLLRMIFEAYEELGCTNCKPLDHILSLERVTDQIARIGNDLGFPFALARVLREAWYELDRQPSVREAGQ